MFSENTELRGSTVAARTSLSIFKDLMKQQIGNFEEKTGEKIRTMDQKTKNLFAVVQTLLIKQKELQVQKFSNPSEIELGDLYRELKYQMQKCMGLEGWNL